MKHLLFLIVIISGLLFSSCTENQRAKSYGGNAEVTLDTGQKLEMVTWKESNLWVLTTEMEDDYIPKTYKFQEESSFGIFEGSYTIKETRNEKGYELNITQ